MPNFKFLIVFIFIQKFILFIFQFLVLKKNKKSLKIERENNQFLTIYLFIIYEMTILSLYKI
jgi:hypothetical protein